MNKIADYFQQNPILFIILAALVIVLVIVILIVIIKAIRKSSASLVSKNEADPLPANKENSSSQALKPSDSQTAETISAQTATNQADVSQNNSGIREPQEQTASSGTAPSVSSQSDPKPSSPTQSAQNANDKPKQSADEAEDKKVSYSGKWAIIEDSENNTYHFELRASNGEKLLTSIDYTTISGTKSGIQTHKNNILKGNFVIAQNKKNQFFFKLLSGSKQLLCAGEPYATRARCENAIESVKRFAQTAVIVIIKSDHTDANQDA